MRMKQKCDLKKNMVGNMIYAALLFLFHHQQPLITDCMIICHHLSPFCIFLIVHHSTYLFLAWG